MIPKTIRDLLGTDLYLVDERNGSVSFHTYTVLGRSDSGDSPLVYKGNTPTGGYSGYLVGPTSPSSSYGPYEDVAMTGVSGQIIQSGRTGIWIHAGDPCTDPSKSWYPLRPTYGCVRIANYDQRTLASQIHSLISSGLSSTGDISISQ